MPRDARDAGIRAAPPLAGLARCAREVLPSRAPVLLAVSGGSDSMALLAAAALVLRAPLHVVHVQHGLRADAARDADFVRCECARRGLPFTLACAPPTASHPGRGETAARGRRLAALQHAALAIGASHVLLGHHRDDSLETMLLHLRRGHRGDRALAGIPTLRPLGGGITLVHPFLATCRPPGRVELAAFRAAHGVPHVEDETNADLAIARNAVRAWLAASACASGTHGPGDAGEARDAMHGTLLALQRRARARLLSRVTRVAGCLVSGLAPDGLGARLDARALLAGWDAAPDGALRDEQGEQGEHVAELLRLLGGCLAARRRLDPRAAVIGALRRLAAAGRGELSLPATPRPLLVRATRGALLLPDEALGAGSPETRVLQAVAQLPLHLP